MALQLLDYLPISAITCLIQWEARALPLCHLSGKSLNWAVLTNIPSKSMWYFAGGFSLCRANYIIHNGKVITHPHCVG